MLYGCHNFFWIIIGTDRAVLNIFSKGTFNDAKIKSNNTISKAHYFPCILL